MKQAGHEVDLLDYTRLDLDHAGNSLAERISEFEPQLIAISIRSFEWDLVKQKLLPELTGSDIPVVVGGPHPTAVPESVMEEPQIDFLVRGEGERTMLDLVEALNGGGDPYAVEGCWSRQGGSVSKSDVRPLLDDLDSLPFPDWDIWDERHFMNAHYQQFVEGIKWIGVLESSRGCPYACPYCISPLLHKLYKGKGKYHREKSVDRTIAEVLDKKERYGLDYVNFVDETFLLRDERVEEFCDRWISDVKLPFRFGTRPETVTDERVRMVKEAGVTVIGLGIESGDPQYRKDHLRRRYSQEQVRSAVATIKRHNIIVFGFFIMGMPHETRESMQQTFELMRSLDLDHYMITLCYPFVGTPFYGIAEEEGLFHGQESDIANIWQDTPLSLPGLSRKKLLRIRNLSSYFARRDPRWDWMMRACEKNGAAYNLWKVYRRAERRLAPGRILD